MVKQNIHRSGALGLLLQSGQIKPITEVSDLKSIEQETPSVSNETLFKTTSGITFRESELMYLDTAECEPWKYANRLDDDLGDLNNLIKSIKENEQLQPALVRPHTKPHDDFKYEIIFGRRRYLACQRLGIKLLVIKKDITNNQDAISLQNAENKFRKDVSNYSNSIHFRKLLDDGIFSSAKELAEYLDISQSSLTEILAYNKIPQDIINNLPDIHSLSISLALSITSLLRKNKMYHRPLLALAPEIGLTLSSPAKLEKAVENAMTSKKESNEQLMKIVSTNEGRRLFTVKFNEKGVLTLALDKKILSSIDLDGLYEDVEQHIINALTVQLTER